MTVPSSTSSPAGARFVRDSGYEGCVELTNAVTRVVLEPNAGGRVLSYRREGAEILWQDPAQHGPLAIIAPGGECAFTEDWWLEPFAFPSDRVVDLPRLRAVWTKPVSG